MGDLSIFPLGSTGSSPYHSAVARGRITLDLVEYTILVESLLSNFVGSLFYIW